MSSFHHGSGIGGGSSGSGVGVGAAMNYNVAQQQQQQPQSMTIDEMRLLHRTALSEAESKRTELRLVLASRYRELVGSSDEVLHMRERAEELHSLIGELPTLVDRVVGAAKALENDDVENAQVGGVGEADLGGDCSEGNGDTSSRKLFANDIDHQNCENDDIESLVAVRGELSRLPRDIHRCLDNHDVHGAASALIALFDIIVACCADGDGEGESSSSLPSSSSLSIFPLAIALASSSRAHSSKDMVMSGLLPSRTTTRNNNAVLLLHMQMKMVYLHVQTLPSRTVQLARRALLQSAAEAGEIVRSGRGTAEVGRGREGSTKRKDMGRRSFGGGGAHAVAAALSALDLLDVGAGHEKSGIVSLDPTSSSSTRAAKLIDLYYESKARLLDKLLNKLALPSSSSSSSSVVPSSATPSSSSLDAASVTQRAEVILCKIVMILQYDVILYPYQIFKLRKFRISNNNDENRTRGKNGVMGAEENQIVNSIMSTLPSFDPELLKSKASRFLEAHLPLIRTKVKSVLMIIAGTTASRLGHIRQTLYDKTDGVECIMALDNSGVCTWDEAVGGMVDVRLVNHGMTSSSGGDHRGMNGQGSTRTATPRRFSLWGALFSNTFSSLVHSLLTSSFHSVHARVVSTLRTSLARAPPFECMLPHEARRNALRIASDLDASLRRVSDDAHELLVHAEEREESERRLRQSLYVQTCEIMGRLLNELRRMLVVGGGRDEDATKVLIVGRLCHLLKFRLISLPSLLDPKNSPAAATLANMGGGGGKSISGMITLVELRSSFGLADDDDDGLISFDEAMEAMESAFSGTHSRGAEMVRDTLLLSHPTGGSSGMGEDSTTTMMNNGNASYASSNAFNKSTPENVTLSELVLLSARGLRHDASGPESALGTVQSSLDDIVDRCFKEWARAALSPSLKSFTKTMRENMDLASSVSEVEWRRLHGLTDKDDDAMLKIIQEVKGDASSLDQSRSTTVGEVSPHVVSYLLAVSGILNRSICPADSLPPVPSLDCAKALGISIRSDEDGGIPNMMVTIRRSLLGEALTSLSQSLQQEITVAALDDCATNDNGTDILRKCSPSSLVQLDMDIKFIHHCFFERNQHDISIPSDDSTADDNDQARRIIEGLTKRLSASVVDALGQDALAINGAISESLMRVFASCDLFLTPLFGGHVPTGDTSLPSTTTASSSSSLSFTLNPLASSRRFILLPIQADKSQSELQLRTSKYGKKIKEEKASNSGKDSYSTSGNALGTGLGFLSSMLSTKNR